MRNKNGFSLLELLVAIGILAVVVVGMMKLYVYVPRLSESSASTTVAMQELVDKMDEIRNTPFSDIISTYACECGDYFDNDSDGLIDYDSDGGDPKDSGCTSYIDNSESDSATLPKCSDNIDNDGDGLVDYDGDGTPSLADADYCSSATDNAENHGCTFSLSELNGTATIYILKSQYVESGTDETNNLNDDDGNDGLYDVRIVAVWTDSDGRSKTTSISSKISRR